MAAREFSFTSFQANNPTAPPPGDRLDGELDRLAKAIASPPPPPPVKIGKNQLEPGLFDQIGTSILTRVEALATGAKALLAQVHAAARDAFAASRIASAQNALAQDAAQRSSSEAQAAAASADQAEAAADQAEAFYVETGNAARDTAGDVATCQAYADVTYAWAEHMPDPIPPNILAVMGITGDHWSSRWWANQAALAVAGGIGGWAPGSVAFATSPTTLGQDSPNFFWDDTSNRLGIGTNAPGAKLTVSSAASGAPQAFLPTPQVWAAQEGAVAVGLFDAYSSNSTGHGAWLIGRRSRGTAAAPTALMGGDTLISIMGQGRKATAYSGTVVQIEIATPENWTDVSTPTYTQFWTTPSGSTTQAVAMRIADNGNVGIGTTVTAGWRLNVQGAGGLGLFTSTGANICEIALNNAAGGQQDRFTFYDAGVLKWMIGKQTDNTFFIYDNANGRSPLQTDPSGNLLLQATGGGVTVGAPTGGSHGAGTIAAVQVYGNNVLLTSDANLKTDIAPLPECLPLVAAVEPKTFRWKTPEPVLDIYGNPAEYPPDHFKEINMGFLAQDVAAAIGGKDDAIDLGAMVAILWQAVREMSDKIEVLEARS
jgi:Chaperone of endosialidase